jgi:hypothetical protein
MPAQEPVASIISRSKRGALLQPLRFQQLAPRFQFLQPLG